MPKDFARQVIDLAWDSLFRLAWEQADLLEQRKLARMRDVNRRAQIINELIQSTYKESGL